MGASSMRWCVVVRTGWKVVEGGRSVTLGTAPLHPGAQCPDADRYVLMPYVREGLTGRCEPCGYLFARSEYKAKAVGRMLCLDYGYECIVDHINVSTGEILESWEFGRWVERCPVRL